MIINQDDKVLLVKGYKRGWEFPGGFVNSEESIKAAAIREAKEESGIDIELTDFLGVEHHIKKTSIVVVFKGRPIGGTIETSNETKDVGYFDLNESLKIMAIDHFKDRLLRCVNENQIPFFIEIP
ncbi:NUDIX hydrolase [Cytobacillus depressus]|uniref:NUDIX hydrolase n=2 Tax=Cytobacillus depressus TaxID=1602942 RepID=A0A6L3VCA2_9BACI|nr:NUDIX hydrolase [Cytobacillus depressus]